jgi:hypothetical protein
MELQTTLNNDTIICSNVGKDFTKAKSSKTDKDNNIFKAVSGLNLKVKKNLLR